MQTATEVVTSILTLKKLLLTSKNRYYNIMNFELQVVYISMLPFICKGGDGCPVPKRFVADIVTLIAKILL